MVKHFGGRVSSYRLLQHQYARSNNTHTHQEKVSKAVSVDLKEKVSYTVLQLEKHLYVNSRITSKAINSLNYKRYIKV